MADEAKVATPNEVVKDPVTPAADPVEQKAPENEKEQTVSEALAINEPEKESKMVPEAAFLGEKKQRKALEKEVKDLRRLVEEGGTREEVSADIESIAEKYGVDPSFLSELSKTFKAQAKRELDAELESKLKPIEEKSKQEKIEQAFQQHFTKTMEKMPDFKDLVDPDVIKTLSLDPKNANKTLSQIVEDTYGNFLTGRKTIETTTPRGGKDPEKIDYAKAAKDPSYYKEIMSDPEKKREYNANLHERLPL